MDEAVVIGCRCGVHDLSEDAHDLIDTRAYDLQGRYAAFNARLFDGRLPTIPIRFGRLKGVGGVVNAKVISKLAHPGMKPATIKLLGRRAYLSRDLVPDSLNMVIDAIYQRSEQNLDAILIHEMIHVWFIAVEHDYDEAHGAAFLKMARDLGEKIGYPIPLTDKTSDLIAAPTKDKPLGVLLFGDKHGRSFVYAIVSLKVLRENLDAFLQRWRGYVPRLHSEVSCYEITSAAWTAKALTTTVQRNLDYKLKRYHLQSEELLADLRVHGRLLGSVEASEDDS